MAFNVTALSLPAREPVSLAEMKAHLTIDPSFTDDDSVLADMISGARQLAEELLGKTLVPRQWLFVRDNFPAFRYAGQAPSRSDYDSIGNYNFSGLRWNDSQTIVLPQPPLISVDAIRYTDGNWSLQLLDPVTYQVDTVSEPGRVMPAAGAYWPVTAPVANAVQVMFTSGYAQTISGEMAFVPAAPGPFAVTLQHASTFLGVLSIQDAGSGLPVSAAQYAPALSGVITFDAALAGRGVAITYRVLNIPASVKMAIKMRAGTFYANREDFVGGSTETPSWFEDMLIQGAGRASLFGYTGRQ